MAVVRRAGQTHHEERNQVRKFSGPALENQGSCRWEKFALDSHRRPNVDWFCRIVSGPVPRAARKFDAPVTNILNPIQLSLPQGARTRELGHLCRA